MTMEAMAKMMNIRLSRLRRANVLSGFCGRFHDFRRGVSGDA